MNRKFNSMRFANEKDIFLELDEIERNRRRMWYPSTLRISSFIRNYDWGAISVEPIYGRRFKLLELRVTMIPRGSWRLKKENFEELRNNLYERSHGVLIILTNDKDFGRGVIKIAVNPFVRNYDQGRVITALRQMRNIINSNFNLDY